MSSLLHAAYLESSSSQPHYSERTVEVLDNSEQGMAAPFDSHQGVATGAVAAQDVSHPPHVLQPSHLSTDDHHNASASLNSAHEQVADRYGSASVSVHHHQQQQYPQQYTLQHHSQYLLAPPPTSLHQYQQPHGQHTSFPQGSHDRFYRYPPVEGYHQYPAYGDHHYNAPLISPRHGSQMQIGPQYAYSPSISPTQREVRLPLSSENHLAPSPSYHTPQYPQSMPQAAMPNGRLSQQMTAPPTTEPSYAKRYQPYHLASQHSPGLPKSSPQDLSPLPEPEREEKVKASTIYAPHASMDGTATNYGRLPDGKIIELYPAMMRTMQACEYCRSRKAKCTGGLPCERCEDKGMKCKYAVIDVKKKIKTTTSERDLSKKGSRRIKIVPSAKANGSSGSGAGLAKPASPMKSTSSRPTRKSARNSGSAKPNYTEAVDSPPSVALSVIEDVPLDLSCSPFTPASLLYQEDTNETGQQGLLMPSLPPQFAAITQPFHQSSSPASTASQAPSSVDLFAAGPAPEANFSPLPYFSSFYQDETRNAWSHDEIAAPSAPQKSAFRVDYIPTQYTNFF